MVLGSQTPEAKKPRSLEAYQLFLPLAAVPILCVVVDFFSLGFPKNLSEISYTFSERDKEYILVCNLYFAFTSEQLSVFVNTYKFV